MRGDGTGKMNMQSYTYAVMRRLLILKIKLQLGQKNYVKAEALIKSALSTFSQDSELLDLAQDVFAESQNWDELYRLHMQVESMYPDNLNLKLYLGSVLFLSYRYSEAVARFKYCIENWNLGDQYVERLANTYARLSISYVYLGQWDLAQSTLNKATERGIWDPDIAYAHVLITLEKNGPTEVLKYLDQNIVQHPRLHTLYLGKALYAEHFLHDPDTARIWYIKALNKINSFQFGREYKKHYLSTGGYAIAWYILKGAIGTCVQTHKIRQAYLIIWLAKLLIWDSGIDTGIFATYINVMKGSLTSAEKTCRAMLRKNLSRFSRVEYLSLLAHVQSKQGRLKEAIVTMEQALTLNSQSLENWVALGSIRLQNMDWTSAAKTYEKVLEMNPFDFKSWGNLGACYIGIGDLDAARKTYEKTVKLNPSEASIWVYLADTYLKLGNNDLAASAYQNGLEHEWLDSGKRQYALQMLKQLRSE